MHRRLATLLLGILLGASAARGGEKVVVHLTSGARIEATLVAQDASSVTLSTGDGTVRFPRSLIARIDGQAGTPSEAEAQRTRRPEVIERPTPPGSLEEGRPDPWPEAEEEKIEGLLDRFFAAKDDAARKAAFAELARTKLERRLEDLEHMREAAAKAKGLHRHLPVPWRKGAERGWFNLAVPADYTPAKAWPLILALHGMPSDGDNLVSWYAGWFPPRGYIVVFPTTIHPASFWPAPNEKLEVLRLLRYLSRTYRLDYRRIYCTGASGGGIGTWHWLTTLPELFSGGISFSAAGTILDKRLEKLKGVPFYVHHGTADYIPVASVEKAVEAARRYGAEIEFYVSPGTGHTPPGRDWNRAFEWLAKLPPKKTSARYLLESAEGALPIGYPRYLPFAVAPEPQALAKIHADAKARAPAWKIPSQIPADSLLDGLIAVAKILDPACDAQAVRREVKRLADAVRKNQKADAKPIDTLYALNEVFFQTEGFSRDGADPSGESPDGYAVHRVLKLRRGSVFTLAGLYAAAAGELGLPVFAVTTPYHAFARFDDGSERLNIEMTEAGGQFDDKIYTEGYGLRGLPSAATLKAKAASALLAAHLAELGGMARTAGCPETALAAAGAALALDPTCYGALLLQALAAKDGGQDKEALRLLGRAADAWPDYAASRLVQGELFAKAGSGRQAVEAYRDGIHAHLKPYGAAAAYDAEFYYRIAAIYAPLLKEALKAQRASAIGYTNKFNDAILNALRNNPNHPGARKLLVEMGGSVR